jgi:putative ABC transport system substrate-binding protein
VFACCYHGGVNPARTQAARVHHADGGAGLAWPLGARAQQDGSIPRIGILWPGASLPAPPRMEAFRQGLRDLGFIDGQNVIIELRYAQGGVQQLPELAAELVRLKIDVIQASGDLAPRIAQQATTTVPIVAMSDDILGAGLSVSRTPQLKRE